MEAPFKTLVIREIQGAIIDFRFWVVLALCLSIIPLSFYVSVKNYSQRLSDYQQEVQSYRDRTSVHSHMAAEGVHPPSPLSIFSQGLGNRIPYKVITSNDGNYRIEYAKPDNKQDLLGEIDFAFIVSFVLSILAIVFTFSAISGDKESGVLRGTLSNAVLRRQVLMAKLFGNYLVFLIPFLFSILVSLLVVYFSGIIPIFSTELFPAVMVMTAISLIFLFAMFNLGLWISALARNSILSVNVLLLIWIVLGLVVPKISPIIGSVIYPVESTGVYESKKAILRLNIMNELEKEERDLFLKIRNQLRPGAEGVDGRWTDVLSAYDEQYAPVREKYDQLLASETEKLVNDYALRCNRQNDFARNIARLSPVYAVNCLMAELSATGYSELEHFIQQASVYQKYVEQNYYDKMKFKIYRDEGGYMTKNAGNREDRPTEIPVLENYKSVGIGQVLQQNRVDIMLLCLYSLLFFVCGFISFLRFDVR
ncbi:MAG: ABC transporter permease subunit [Bacteroidales bacterium]|jgi:ABC-type transport system involved in multi-copper enzyme maturation permease subunit|nr:ABC transporter permease subunit [Bacteroidales bacterium]